MSDSANRDKEFITEDYLINPNSGGYPHIAGIYSEEQVESHKALPDACHKWGAKVFSQLYHAGRQATAAVNGGMTPVSCSPIPDPWNNSEVHELTVDEIHSLVKDFAKAASNCKRAGFDGVEIHAAHGYLIHEFTSPNCNKRTDEYGGTYENRMRFLKEIMEAARAASIKGHKIVLFESTDKLGGQYLTACFPPHKGDFAGYLHWIIRQVSNDPNIEIRLQTPLTADIVKADSPDKVIIATGAKPVERPYPGMEKNHVIEAQGLLRGKAQAGLFCVVIGGGLIGAETASFLATQCKANVTLTTRQEAFGTTMSPDIMVDLKAELVNNFVDIRTETSLKEVTEDGVILVKNGVEEFLHCDTVVTAFGTRAYNVLSEHLEGVCDDVGVVGDARQARLALQAIREGFEAGLNA